LDHVSEKADEDGGEAALETQDWNWKEPYETWDLGIDGHIESGATMSKAKDDREDGEKDKDKGDEEKYGLRLDSKLVRWKPGAVREA
jgi:hypothetical protein